MIQLGGRYCTIEFGLSMKLVRLIKVCLNETYNKACIGKHLSDNFPTPNGLKQDVFNFTLQYAIWKVQENMWDWNTRIYEVSMKQSFVS
jgi:hypothetical protein